MNETLNPPTPSAYIADPVVTADLCAKAESRPTLRYTSVVHLPDAPAPDPSQPYRVLREEWDASSGVLREEWCPKIGQPYRTARYCFPSSDSRVCPEHLLEKAVAVLALKAEELLRSAEDVDTLLVHNTAQIADAKNLIESRVGSLIENPVGRIVFLRGPEFAAAVGAVSGVEEVAETVRVDRVDQNGATTGLRTVFGAPDVAYLLYVDERVDALSCMSSLQVRYYERHVYEYKTGPNGVESRVVDDYCLHLAVPHFVIRLQILGSV